MTNAKTETQILSANVTKWTNNAVNAETGFFQAVYDAIVLWKEHQTTDPLAKLITIVNGQTAKRIKKFSPDKMHFATALQRILSECIEGMTKRHDKESDFGQVFTWKENAGTTASMDKLKALAESGSTVRGDSYKKAFPAIKKHSETVAELYVDLEAAPEPEKEAIKEQIVAQQATETFNAFVKMASSKVRNGGFDLDKTFAAMRKEIDRQNLTS